MQVWSFLAVGDVERQHGGNDGYDDQLDEHYSWDSTVPNHRRPNVGDICVIRDGRGVLGVSRIEDLRREAGIHKARRRCPTCGRTGFKMRTTVTPPFRCPACTAEFAEPAVEQIVVTEFKALYRDDWVAVDGAITAKALEPAYVSKSRQHAIRRLDPRLFLKCLGAKSIRFNAGIGSGSAEGGGEIPGGRRPASGQRRIGQSVFRRRLLERFGARCAISGPQPVECLDAAHVYRFAKEPHHDPAGGLLLRRDLHALFDAGLIQITDKLIVRVDPQIQSFSEIARFDGAPLDVDPADPLLPQLCQLLE